MYCHCGCGQKTKLAKNTSRRDKTIKGEPLKFIHGHNSKIPEKHPNWNGGITKGGAGYIYIFRPDHPFCISTGYVMEHRLVYEEFCGRFLSSKEVIHHKNRKKTDNALSNLFLCRDKSHHMEIHEQEKSFKACGNSEYRWCAYCKSFDDVKNLTRRSSGRGYYHKNCVSKRKKLCPIFQEP
jgi:hypothetical protein